MKFQRLLGLLLISFLSGCASGYSITYNTEPTGATIICNGQNEGYSPVELISTKYFHNVRKEDGTLNPILGEDELALSACLSYLLEDNNFVIKAYSGTGKTVIMDAIFALLPEEFYYVLEHLSETAVWYDAEKINRARFIAIPEAQKLPEAVIEVVKEVRNGQSTTSHDALSSNTTFKSVANSGDTEHRVNSEMSSSCCVRFMSTLIISRG